MKRLFSFLVVIFLATPHGLIHGAVLSTSSSPLLVSEVMANPLDEDTGEFIELWNSSDTAFNLSSWTVSDPGDLEDVIQDYTGLYDIGTSGLVIPPKGFALIVDQEYAGEYNAEILAHADITQFIVVTLNDSTLGNGLGNASDSLLFKSADLTQSIVHSWQKDTANAVSWAGVSLLNNPTFISSKQSFGSSPAYTNNTAPISALEATPLVGEAPLSVTLDASDSEDLEGLPLQYVFDLGNGTTKQQNEPIFSGLYEEQGNYFAKVTVRDAEGQESTSEVFIEVHPKTVCTLAISEVLPNPEGADTDTEFIEIFNSGDTSCDVSRYAIDDGEGGSTPFILPKTSLAPQSYKAWYSSETNISLNNSTESVRILDVEGKVVQELSYESSREGLSYAQLEEGFAWTLQPTPGSENTLELPEEEEENTEDHIEESEKSEVEKDVLSVQEARKQPKGKKIVVEGTISVQPGVLSKNYLYIQNNVAGLQVYSSKKDFPSLAVGQKIRVYGTISEITTGKRLLIQKKEDIEILAYKENVPVLPRKTGKVTSHDDGLLVQVSGKIESKKGNSFFLNDSTGVLKITIQEGSSLTTKDVTTGKLLSVKGVVTTSSSGIQLMPRAASDLSAHIPVTELYKAGSSNPWIVIKKYVIRIAQRVTDFWKSIQGRVLRHL